MESSNLYSLCHTTIFCQLSLTLRTDDSFRFLIRELCSPRQRIPSSNPNPPSGYNLIRFHSSIPVILLVPLNPRAIAHSQNC
jgi:hypothetical protein